MKLSRIALLLALLISLSASIAAQIRPPVEEQDTPLPDRWRGLVVDESAPEDAIKVLGKPTLDKMEGADTYPLNQRLTLDEDSKDARKLSYDKIEGMSRVELLFKKDKLVLIELRPNKKIKASALSRIYGIHFSPKISNAYDVSPRVYDTRSVAPADYPSNYYLIGLSDTTYISAEIKGSVAGMLLGGNTRGKITADDDGGYPGKVSKIQIISRKLDNREGADILK
ncbi:MAG TPA: hypothetical protein VGN95_02950 [Pyrinomonadaceae bacterium]|jgi:hypothetical protein|nr:hypothetical protein [Pyrinomonadaceae bacterium]